MKLRWNCHRVIDRMDLKILNLNSYFAGGQIGSLLANVLGGVILNCDHDRWENIFYYFGGGGILSALLWYFFVFSDPESHPTITAEEKLYLREAIGCTQRKKVSIDRISECLAIGQILTTNHYNLFVFLESRICPMEVHINIGTCMGAHHC